MKFFPGSTVELFAYFRLSEDQPLVDPDSPPSFSVYKNGTSSPIHTDVSVKQGVGIYKAVWQSPDNIDTSKTYKIVWNATINGIPVPGAEEEFSFQDTGPVFTSTNPIVVDPTEIIIPQRDLDLIKSVLAWPCTENVLLSDDQIKKVILYPAMMEYFTKFPLVVRDQKAISNRIEVPFPDEYTYGVKDCRVVGKFYQTGGHNSSFWSIVNFNRFYPFSAGSYGSRYSAKFQGYNPNGLRQETWAYKQVIDTYGNEATFRYEVDKNRRVLIVEANSGGYVDIQWAKWSNNFEAVDYPRRIDVINLAQSNLLQHTVDALQISQETSAEVQLGIAEMQTRATELRERVIEKWDTWQDVHIARIS